MANLEKDRVESETLAKLKSDPELSALAQQVVSSDGFSKRQLMSQYKKLAESKGLLPQNYDPQWGGNELSVDFQNWFERNGAKLAGAAATLPFAAAALPALFGGGGAAAGAGTGASVTAPTVTAGAGSGLLPKLLNVGKTIAPALSAASAGRAAGRAAEDEANLNYDRTNIDRSQVAGQDYQRNLSNALRGGLLQGVKDSTITAPEGVPMGKIEGGLRPSAILGREQIGADLQRQAMMHLLDSDQSGDTRTPSLTPRPQSNGLDTALNIAAPVLSVTDLLAGNGASKPAVMPTTGALLPRPTTKNLRFLPPAGA